MAYDLLLERFYAMSKSIHVVMRIQKNPNNPKPG